MPPSGPPIIFAKIVRYSRRKVYGGCRNGNFSHRGQRGIQSPATPALTRLFGIEPHVALCSSSNPSAAGGWNSESTANAKRRNNNNSNATTSSSTTNSSTIETVVQVVILHLAWSNCPRPLRVLSSLWCLHSSYDPEVIVV